MDHGLLAPIVIAVLGKDECNSTTGRWKNVEMAGYVKVVNVIL